MHSVVSNLVQNGTDQLSDKTNLATALGAAGRVAPVRVGCGFCHRSPGWGEVDGVGAILPVHTSASPAPGPAVAWHGGHSGIVWCTVGFIRSMYLWSCLPLGVRFICLPLLLDDASQAK